MNDYWIKIKIKIKNIIYSIMTIINNIEIDFIRYKKNEIKDAINNKLHVIAVLSNSQRETKTRGKW
jgi:hypothetical protein